MNENARIAVIIYATLTILSIAVIGCSQHPIRPEDTKVQVTKEQPSPRCREIGPVKGTTANVKVDSNLVIEDLKADAARKGANYIYLESFSAYGGAAQGMAYFCP